MTTETLTREFRKQRLILQLDNHGAPERWNWEGVRFLRNEDGSDAEQPRMLQVPATEEEVSAHVGAAVVSVQELATSLQRRVHELEAEVQRLTGAT